MSEIVQSKYADVDRDDAVMRLRRGEWTPADAKAWSNAYPKERPFEFVPSHDRFEPMRKPEWTLAMAAAWIIWRTADEVREHWDAYLVKCAKLRARDRTFGVGRREVGWEECQSDPVSLSDIVRECARADPDGSKLKALDNIECLWNSLKEGQLEATGLLHFLVGGRRRDVAPVEPRRMVIPRHEWIDLSPLHSYEGMPNSVGTAMDIEPRYDEVHVWRDDVLRLWLPPRKSINKQSATASVTKTAKPVETHTGLPGRPNAKHLINAEFQRMVDEKRVPSTLKATAEFLVTWFSGTYPKLAQPTVGTIQNNIRDAHRKSETHVMKCSRQYRGRFFVGSFSCFAFGQRQALSSARRSRKENSWISPAPRALSRRLLSWVIICRPRRPPSWERQRPRRISTSPRHHSPRCAAWAAARYSSGSAARLGISAPIWMIGLRRAGRSTRPTPPRDCRQS